MKERISPRVKMAKNVFDSPERVATRDGYGYGLLELGKKNKDVVALCADLASSTRTKWFAEKYPERYFSVGVAEQDMIGIGAGLSSVGKIPYLSSFGVFCAGRVWDQIRVSLCYSDMNVKIGASHCGVNVGEDGATHHSLEDIGLTRILPNMNVIAPCDYIETRKATIKAAEIHGPVFIRFGRDKTPVITTEETPFRFGKADTYIFGDDVAIFASGHMLYESLMAAKKLDKKGIKARVVNMHTIKPIDEKAIIKAAKETGAMVTAEEHQAAAGFGSAIAEVVVENYPVPLKRVGVMDAFGESGPPSELMKYFKLTSDDIVKAADNAMQRKKR